MRVPSHAIAGPAETPYLTHGSSWLVASAAAQATYTTVDASLSAGFAYLTPISPNEYANCAAQPMNRIIKAARLDNLTVMVERWICHMLTANIPKSLGC